MDAALRTLVRRRASECCEYCRLPQSLDVLPFQIDHIIAEKHHGPTVEENLALSCFNCNAHKGLNIAGIDPLSLQLVPLFNPRRDEWDAHFRWSGASLSGLTATARATTDVLRINLNVRVQHRRTLADAGHLVVETSHAMAPPADGNA